MQHHLSRQVLTVLSAILAIGVFFGITFSVASAQTVTDNIDSPEVKAKVLKIKGKNGIIRHSAKKGTVTFNSKVKIKKKTTHTKALDVRKKIYNPKGKVLIKDDLTVTGTINGVDLSALEGRVDVLEAADNSYTAGSGLTLTDTSFSLSTGCSTNQILKYDGDSWECAADSESDPGTTYSAGSGLALTGTTFSLLTTCSSGEVLAYSGSAWACASNTDTTYTAGTGIDITSEVISATLGTSIAGSEIEANTITDADVDLGSAWTITGNWVNTANPWADNEVADTLTIGSSSSVDDGALSANIPLLDAAGTITGNWVNTANPWADNEVAEDLTITAGTIENTPIGSSTASTGNFSQIGIYSSSIKTDYRQQLPRTGSTVAIDTSVGAPTANSVQPSAIVNNAGALLIAYHDASSATLKMVTCPLSSSVCGSPTTVEVDSNSESGYYASIALLSDGTPVISHFNNTSRDLILSICDDVSCASPTNVSVDTTGFVGYATSLAIDGNGFPIISYMDLSGNLKVAACDDASACASPTITTVQTDADTTTVATSIAINPNTGFPVVAYVDNSDDLSLVQCTTADCSTDTTVVMDATITAADLALTISDSGYPLVAYSDTGNLIKTAACTAAGCAEANATLTTVSSSGSTYVHATTGIDGFPVIAYESNSTDNLEAVRCGSTDCAANSDAITIDSGAVDNVAVAIGHDGLPYIIFHETGDSNLEIHLPPNKYLTDYFFTR